MNIEKGAILKTRTKTFNDVFGDVVWEVAETGLDAHDKDRPGAMDGVKCVMLGGTGPSARAGYTVYDSEFQIQRDIAAGITTVVPASEKDKALGALKGKGGSKPCGSGVVEVSL